MTSYVAGFCFDNTLQSVLLIRKNKPEWQKGKFNAIGGKIENNETPLQAMNREFAEETLCCISTLDWVEFCTLNGPDWKVHFFYSHAKYTELLFQSIVYVQNAISALEEEKIANPKVKIASSNDFDSLPNLRWLIPLALNCLTDAENCEHFTITEN